MSRYAFYDEENTVVVGFKSTALYGKVIFTNDEGDDTIIKEVKPEQGIQDVAELAQLLEVTIPENTQTRLEYDRDHA